MLEKASPMKQLPLMLNVEKIGLIILSGVRFWILLETTLWSSVTRYCSSSLFPTFWYFIRLVMISVGVSMIGSTVGLSTVVGLSIFCSSLCSLFDTYCKSPWSLYLMLYTPASVLGLWTTLGFATFNKVGGPCYLGGGKSMIVGI
jgi:hypothetical protein